MNSKMYALVFSCVLILEGVTGHYLFPAWRPSADNASFQESEVVTNETAATPYYFQTFNLRKFNPVYWFYDTSETDKVDKLYELVRCVIEDQDVTCREKLQLSRKLFEKKKNVQKGEKKDQLKTTTIAVDTIKSSTEKNGQVLSSEIENKNQNEVEIITKPQNKSSTQKSTTSTGTGETTTPISEIRNTVVKS